MVSKLRGAIGYPGRVVASILYVAIQVYLAALAKAEEEEARCEIWHVHMSRI